MPARSSTALSMVVAVVIALVLLPTAAADAATSRPYGRIGTTMQHRDGSVGVSGWAFDPAHPDRSIRVCLAVAGKCVHELSADRSSPAFDETHHIGGRHAFATRIRSQRPGVTIQLRNSAGAKLASQRVLTAGARIVALAKRFVGKTRYADGGSTPKQGFDCSGYTSWLYSHAGVATLPHSAEAQRHVRHMHRIAPSRARAGDLVFYFDGATAYHVAIYAGHGMQYAAATPADGIRYQAVWSSDVEYRTDWH